MSTDWKMDNNLLTKMEEELNGKSLDGNVLLHNYLEMQSESNQNPHADTEWRRGARWTEQEHSLVTISGQEVKVIREDYPIGEDEAKRVLSHISSILMLGEHQLLMLFNAAHSGMSGYAAAGVAPAQLPLFAPII